MKTLSLLFATTNEGKVREIRGLLEGLPLNLLFLQDFSSVPEVEETGATFQENARLKAHAYRNLHLEGFVAAEDSGLVVPALGDQPGVLSARFGGFEDDRARNDYLLQRMEGLRGPGRMAYYEAVVVLLDSQGNEEVFTGQVHGSIAPAPDGSGGFGYDPLFIHPDLGRTFGNASRDEKNILSHRGKAMRLLKAWLEEATRDEG